MDEPMITGFGSPILAADGIEEGIKNYENHRF